MECLSYCVANSINLTRLDTHLKRSSLYTSVKSRDVLKIHVPGSPQSFLFVFKNGTIVAWGLKRYQMTYYVDFIKEFSEKPTLVVVHDEFSYRTSDKTAIEPHDYFDVDCLTIDKSSDCDELRLSFSYGFSQSVKLQYFETMIETLIEKYTPILDILANRSSVHIHRTKIREVIGEILATKSEMNLISNFLYHPKYFWQHPTLEEYYTMLERYLHIQRRVNAINHRLDTINDIFDMLNDYLENRHAHRLEIIIIFLIAIEILFGVLNFHF
ncbi:MAG: RMD1 family protein [Legionellaceae bacterium]|nr:RMD1 family protein [Legionellaceae bacterium]